MSGKYMKIKRVIIPTLTMVLLSSMLFGCSAATKEETYDMLQQSTEIELEYAVPDYDTTEEFKVELLPWLQLSSLETHPELRSAFEELLGVTGTTGDKSGIIYINSGDITDQNNTLFIALGNDTFMNDYVRNDAQQSKIEEIANAEYTDIEDNQSIPAVINAYFELLPDQADGQFDGSATISRAQAMTLLMRATTSVNEAQAPDEDADFTAKVGETQYTNFAAPMNEYSYLNTDNGLTDKTFNTTMSRGEYIYMLTNAIFNQSNYNDYLDGVGMEDESLSEDVTLTTVKDGGNITFQESISNPEKGLPTDMYKTLARAVALGFSSEDDLNWDEAITKSEAITIFIDAANTYYTNTQVDYKYLKPETTEGMNGNATGDLYVSDEEDLTIEDEATLAQQEAQEADEQLQAESVADYTVIAMDAQKMYAHQTVNLRQGPATTYDKVGSLSTNQSVTVTGYVETASNKWYQLSTEEFVSAKYLGIDKVVAQAPSNSSSSNTGSSQSSDTGVYIIDGTGSGTRDGSSRENRSGAVDNWGGDGAITGGNLH